MSASLRDVVRGFMLLGAIAFMIFTLNSCKSSSSSTDAGQAAIVPMPPSGLRVVPITMHWVNILWSENLKNPVNGFILQRETGVSGQFVTIANLGPAVRIYNDSGLAANLYTYRILAFNDNGNSRYSPDVSVNLLLVVFTPGRLIATAVSLGRVDLTWVNNTTNADSIRIERRFTNTAVGAIIATVSANATSYSDLNAPCGAEVSYRIQAYNHTTASNFTSFANVSTFFSTQTLLQTGIRTQLNSVSLIDNLNAFTVGAQGTILHTTDGGGTWLKEATHSSTTFNGVCAISNLLAIATGDQGKMIRTTDGGASWNPVVTGASVSLYSITFVDADTGYVTGTNGLIYKSTDAGLTWKSITTGVANTLFALQFRNKSLGYAVGTSGTIIKTTNGGRQWTSQKTDIFSTLRSVSFSSDSAGFAVGVSGVILHTIDGGNTWVEERSPVAVLLTGVSALSDYKALIIGEQGTMMYTVNGGTNWLRIPQQSSVTLYNIMQFPETGDGFIVGAAGVIYQIQSCH
ncbi:MAG: YCF48-related protein [Bacteroidota bacterium]